jgi:hypothetical protein
MDWPSLRRHATWISTNAPTVRVSTICAGITERVSIKWPITLAFVRLNSWDVIANKNSTLVPVCRVKMAPVASQHDLNPNSIVNVYQVNLKSFKILFKSI